jgi:tetratricopeptide (TPR) repeat protein
MTSTTNLHCRIWTLFCVICIFTSSQLVMAKETSHADTQLVAKEIPIKKVEQQSVPPSLPQDSGSSKQPEATPLKAGSFDTPQNSSSNPDKVNKNSPEANSGTKSDKKNSEDDEKKGLLENIWSELSAGISILLTIVVGSIIFRIIKAEWNKKSVAIDQIEVPKSLQDNGISGQVVANRIADRIHEIQRVAKVQGNESGVEIGATQIDFQVPVAGISFKTIVKYLKQLFGKSDRRINGEIVIDKGAMLMQLRNNSGRSTPLLSIGKEVPLTDLIKLAAEEILLLSNPLLMAQFRYFEEVQAKDFDKSLKAIKYTLANTNNEDRKRAYLIWGNILTSLRKFDDAESKYENSIDIDNNFAAAYNAWGNSLRNQRKFKESEEKILEAIRLNPHFDFAYANLGLVYADKKMFSIAIDHANKAININPHNSNFYSNLCYYQRELGKYDIAKNSLILAIDRDPNAVWPYIQLASTYRRMRRRSEALSILRQAKDVDKYLPNIEAVEGDILTDECDYFGAIDKYKLAIKKDHYFYWAYLGWANALKRLNLADKAIEKIKEAVANEPTFGNAFILWGDCLCDLNRYGDAMEKYKKAIDLEPWIPEASLGWAMALASQFKYDDAKNKILESINIHPHLARAYAMLGDISINMNRFSDAQDYYYNALEKDKYYIWAYSGLGWSYRRQERQNLAIDSYKQGLEVDKDCPSLIIGLAHALCDLEEFDEALAQIERAIKLEKNNIQALLGRVRILKSNSGLRDLAKAESDIQSVIRLAPYISDGYRALADFYFNQNQLDKALENYVKALSLNEYDNWARYGFANVLAKKGHVNIALGIFERCIKFNTYFTEAYCKISSLQLNQKNYALALTTFENASKINPTGFDLHFQWAKALKRIKNYREASEKLRYISSLGISNQILLEIISNELESCDRFNK